MSSSDFRYTLDPPKFHLPGPTARLISESITFEISGRVAAVRGDSIELEGITAPIGAICEINPNSPDRRLVKVIGFQGVRPIVAPMETMGQIAAGDKVRLLSRSINLRAGASLCGRVIDAFGRPIDNRPLPDDLTLVDTTRQPPESLDRPPIDTALQTGVRAIDTMLTCGNGQRLGIFAGSGVGKSTLLGMLARGSSADRIVICMVGERGREVQEFIQRCLGKEGLQRSVVVVATSDRPAAQRIAATWTATAIAESFRDEGKNVLLLVDSVTRLAMAQRELGLAAGEPPTTRGYPPSVFNLLPQVVERAGRTNHGSITAFYTVLVEGDDNNEPIADTLRGLLDGHIVLSRDLAAQAHWPPIDVLQSLSRLQPHLVPADTMKTVNSARAHLSTYQKNADLISIGAYRTGSDPNVDAAIAMRDPMKLFLSQDASEIAPMEQSLTALEALIRRPTPPVVAPPQ
ncbi:FliI/YscN family ATPase [Novipirellula artificiosorum]|uniref:Flagellum-specific ATP synthase n=1 Tax=Novipirellula artificiosorum TaxID=2528016 RepID=A0A5C6DZV2_9BACT|nr:FliI/YscN family ATPase [Novipirellula artificiosorum]TWU41744.1 Flagellum-specific ATP synthase [Novipirellula artificiosorum]